MNKNWCSSTSCSTKCVCHEISKQPSPSLFFCRPWSWFFFFFLTMLFQTKKIRRRTQKKYLIKNTMNLDDEYISWSLSEVFSPSWITWCYKLKCIGCIHHVITACTKPKIQEDKLGCYDVGGVGRQVCADAGFFFKSLLLLLRVFTTRWRFFNLHTLWFSVLN